MSIKSKANNKNFLDNYDKVFGGKPKIQSIDEVDKLVKANKRKKKDMELNSEKGNNDITVVDVNLKDLQESNDMVSEGSPLVEAPTSKPEQIVETDKNVQVSGKGKLKNKWKLEKKY
jgi:hypothetical protein